MFHRKTKNDQRDNDELPPACRPPYFYGLAAPFVTRLGTLMQLSSKAVGLELLPARRQVFEREALEALARRRRGGGGDDLLKTEERPDSQDRTRLMLVPGGFHEIGLAAREEECVFLRKRLGFIKHALRNGLTLVPVYTVGENRTFDLTNVDGLAFLNNFDVPTSLASSSHFPLPNRVPLRIVCGRGLQMPLIERPSEEEVRAYHKLYVQYLAQLVRRQLGEKVHVH